MRIIAALFLCLAAPPSAHAQDAARQTADAVTAADRAFAHRAAEIGTAAAFREYMDPDEGLAFTGAGKPAHGAAEIFAAMGGTAPNSTLLSWAPTTAWGSKGGDMGVTTGDWSLAKKGTTTPIVTGTYVTVWHKTAAGLWRGLIDIGEPNPPPHPKPATPP